MSVISNQPSSIPSVENNYKGNGTIQRNGHVEPTVIVKGTVLLSTL